MEFSRILKLVNICTFPREITNFYFNSTHRSESNKVRMLTSAHCSTTQKLIVVLNAYNLIVSYSDLVLKNSKYISNFFS